MIHLKLDPVNGTAEIEGLNPASIGAVDIDSFQALIEQVKLLKARIEKLETQLPSTEKPPQEPTSPPPITDLPWWLGSFASRIGDSLLYSILVSYNPDTGIAMFKNGNTANEDFGSYNYGEQDGLAGIRWDEQLGRHIAV
jgi:hypothetical protein